MGDMADDETPRFTIDGLDRVPATGTSQSHEPVPSASAFEANPGMTTPSGVYIRPLMAGGVPSVRRWGRRPWAMAGWALVALGGLAVAVFVATVLL